MKEMKIAMTALVRGGEYLMHLRNGDKSRGAVGLVGFFGGEIEPKDRSELAAAFRELKEETNIISEELEDLNFEDLGFVDVTSDRDNEPVRILAHVFELKLPYDTDVRTRDPRDELVVATNSEIKHDYLGQGRLSPATEMAFKELIMKGVL